jgi:hypothetical protein
MASENGNPDENNAKFGTELHTTLSDLYDQGVIPSLPWKRDDA